MPDIFGLCVLLPSWSLSQWIIVVSMQGDVILLTALATFPTFAVVHGVSLPVSVMLGLAMCCGLNYGPLIHTLKC